MTWPIPNGAGAVGPTGPAGADGADGAAGAVGATGPTGPAGSAASVTYANVATALAAAAGATTVIAGPTTVQLDAIGTAETTAARISNETAAASGLQQRPGYWERRGYGWKTGGGGASVMVEVGDQLRPTQGNANPTAQWYMGYRIPGGSGAWSTFGFFNNSDNSYGVVLQMQTFVATGSGYRLLLNGGGVKENGGGRALFQSAAAGEPWEALSSTSTGNTGARYQFTCDAGTPTAGTFFRVGYGSGSFSTEVFSISSATATRGRVSINGIPIGWVLRSGVSITAAIGDRINGSTTTGAVAITLPAVPSTVSTRDADIIVKDADGNALINNITITPDAGDTIDGAASLVIAINKASVTLCHDGDGTNWRVVSSYLL